MEQNKIGVPEAARILKVSQQTLHQHIEKKSARVGQVRKINHPPPSRGGEAWLPIEKDLIK
jgi:hypothetical protein